MEGSADLAIASDGNLCWPKTLIHSTDWRLDGWPVRVRVAMKDADLHSIRFR